jgi:hypothetical protein
MVKAVVDVVSGRWQLIGRFFSLNLILLEAWAILDSTEAGLLNTETSLLTEGDVAETERGTKSSKD